MSKKKQWNLKENGIKNSLCGINEETPNRSLFYIGSCKETILISMQKFSMVDFKSD